MDDKLYFVIFGIILAVMAVVIPFFLKAETPKPCKKSLILKQTCSTIFLANALIAGLVGDFTRYAALMFVGLCFSWLGDYLLHVNPGQGFFVAGLSSFLVGHIFYTAAYCKAFRVLFPWASIVTVPKIIAYIVILAAAMFCTLFVEKISLGKMFVPCFLYAATITAMAVEAFSLAITIMTTPSNVKDPIFTGIMLMLGAALFVISDYTLSILTFKKGVKKHGALRQVNIWTYFYAQLFLGVSIYFIST
ncbi:MAG TPA: hypothetical protein DCY31_04490 [Ruminococcaceae bacterium]|nr:hypothetical protein [Oscillospiraceae bacterium]